MNSIQENKLQHLANENSDIFGEIFGQILQSLFICRQFVWVSLCKSDYFLNQFNRIFKSRDPIVK